MATPEPFPPSFWDQPAVAAALATCDMAGILREILAYRRWTQEQLADVLGYGQTWVSRVLRGRALNVDQVRDICHRVGVPIHLIRLGTGEGDETNRREFGKAAAATAALAVVPSARLPRRIEADDTTAATLTAVTGLHRRLEATTPARELAPGAVAHIGVTRSVLARSTDGSNRAELLGSLAEAAGFAAWLHADMADTGTARTYYRMAIDTACRAQHGLLTAYMTGSLAQFELDEDPLLGLRLLARARTVIGDRPPLTARAWLSCLEALAHATARDERSCHSALAEAHRAVRASEQAAAPPWPWVFPFTMTKLAGFRALCAVRLARPAEALEAFAESLNAIQPAQKQRATLLLEIASIRRMEAEFDEAFNLASMALSTGVMYGSERVIQAARRFRKSYQGPLLPSVQAFDRRLMTATIG
ncbi:helix-turn-helix transcriptional regulator [Nonomuraea sp. NPDC048916]|uniref:helix-turn-helix transcriptional regulator n=1 Tax=Nonomuraea sp. NPDC048916 TaxID=3154232 RepID=UPI0034079187